MVLYTGIQCGPGASRARDKSEGQRSHRIQLSGGRGYFRKKHRDCVFEDTGDVSVGKGI